jgi:hypothetical protein
LEQNEEPNPDEINAISNIVVHGFMENQTEQGPMGQNFSAHNGTIIGEAGRDKGPNRLNRGFKKYDELSFLDQQRVSCCFSFLLILFRFQLNFIFLSNVEVWSKYFNKLLCDHTYLNRT